MHCGKLFFKAPGIAINPGNKICILIAFRNIGYHLHKGCFS
jgi:hypothetical protein